MVKIPIFFPIFASKFNFLPSPPPHFLFFIQYVFHLNIYILLESAHQAHVSGVGWGWGGRKLNFEAKVGKKIEIFTIFFQMKMQ